MFANIRFITTLVFFVALVSCWLACSNQGENPPAVRDGISIGDDPLPPAGQQPPVLTPIPINSPLGDNDYTVIIQTFAMEAAASAYAYTLRENRVNAFLYPHANNWSVCVGRYGSKSRAERLLRQMWELGYLNSRLFRPSGIDTK